MTELEKPSHPLKIHRETENLMLLAGDLAMGSERWASRPTEIEFAFNNHCNLSCVMCGKSDLKTDQVLDQAVGVAALEEILPCALRLIPSSYSEPFLNDLDLVLELCARHEVFLFIFTNGLLCTEERFRKIQPQVHQLWFSFDSHIKETYESIRVGSDFNKVVENIKTTLRLADEDGTEIVFQLVLMAANLEALPDYVRFIASLGGSRINVAELIPYSSAYDTLKLEGAYPVEKVLHVLNDARKAAREVEVNLTLKLKPSFGGEDVTFHSPPRLKAPLATLREISMESLARIHPQFCSMAAHYLKIAVDGNVFPCCRSPDSLVMGNLHQNTFEEIWNGDAFRAFRKNMFEGRYEVACRTCPILQGQ